MHRSFFLVALAASAIVTSTAGAQVLATGQATIQPSNGPNHPAFNTAVTRNHVIPSNLGSTVGAELRLSLRDLSRPNQNCPIPAGHEALDAGCVTVDWPFFTRRGVNLVAFDSPGGRVVQHLRLDDTMASTAEPSNE